jgi:hypothetical protein
MEAYLKSSLQKEGLPNTHLVAKLSTTNWLNHSRVTGTDRASSGIMDDEQGIPRCHSDKVANHLV